MNKTEYTKMFKLEDTHFWFLAKRYFIDAVIGPYKGEIKNILDLGSGTGGATAYLRKFGDVTGIERYNYAIKLARKRGLNIKRGNLNKLKLPENKYDLISILDVLYHKNVPNEETVLSDAHKSLKKSKYLLITDSALNFLAGSHDKATQGKRRYKLSEMENLVKSRNFKIIRSSYIYFSIFPFVFFKRVIVNRFLGNVSSDVTSINPIINTILVNLMYMEALLLKYVSFPIGSSVIILAVKK